MTENARQTDQLRPIQRAAIRALLTCKTVLEAAEQVGVNDKTIRRWQADPEFAAALRAEEESLLDETARRLLTLQGAALDRLAVLLDAPDAGPTTQLQAVKLALEHVLRLKSDRDIARRLADLEARILDDYDGEGAA